MKHQILSVAVILSTLVVSCKKDKMDTIPPVSPTQAILTFENVVKPMKYVESGIFKGEGSVQMDNKEIKNLILPSNDPKTNSASFTFHAGKGQRLMFTMMFGASKDWFFAAKQPGIELYDEKGNPKTGVITSDVSLWDNGSKENTNGTKEDKVITSIKDKTMPQNLMKLILSYNEQSSAFTLKIINTSKGKKDTEGNSLETPFAPGVWVVANTLGGKLLDEKPFFEAGQKSTKELTILSETGNPEPLYQKVKAQTGIITGLSPAVVVVYTGNKNPLFTMGQKATEGLKKLSQMGDVKAFQMELKKLKEVKEVYIAGNAPIAPNTKVMTTIKKATGDKVAYALMFGYSNDWFYANSTNILTTDRGNLTDKTALYDSGTGVDQFPGAGNRQALFGGIPQKEDKVIEKVGNVFPLPKTSEVIKVTLQ